MEKKHYLETKMEIICFDCEDVITTSNGEYENGGDENDGDDETDP